MDGLLSIDVIYNIYIYMDYNVLIENLNLFHDETYVEHLKKYRQITVILEYISGSIKLKGIFKLLINKSCYNLKYKDIYNKLHDINEYKHLKLITDYDNIKILLNSKEYTLGFPINVKKKIIIKTKI